MLLASLAGDMFRLLPTWATKEDGAFCKWAALGSAKGRASGLQPGLFGVVPQGFLELTP